MRRVRACVGWWTLGAGLSLVTACGVGCTPMSVERAVVVAHKRDRTVSERSAAVRRLGQEQTDLLHRLVWSEAQPAGVRVAAWHRLVEVDPDMWSKAERHLVGVRSPTLVEAVCQTLAGVQNEQTRMTPALLQRLARRSRGGLAVADDDRPEWVGLGWDTQGQRRGGLREWVLREDADRRTRESAWVVLCRWDTPERQRAWLTGLPVDAAGHDAWLERLVWSGEHLDRLPQSFEELRWLTAWWPPALPPGVDKLDPQGLAVRHLSVYRSLPDEFWPGWSGMTTEHASRGGDGLSAGLDRPADLDAVVWHDVVLVSEIARVLGDTPTVRLLFEQADADVADTTSEYGGVLRLTAKPDGAFAEAFEPLIRGSDRRYVPPPELFDQLLTMNGLAYYHFHAQDYDRRAFAGPGLGDLRVAARLGVTCVVLTFLDRDTLNVDVVLPGNTTEAVPTVIDLGSLKRPVYHPE